MNTHRGTTAFGAALGSVLVLALGVDAKAADIYDYDAGLKGGYEVPPPPPSDRGIYIKGYIGQSNPSIGDYTNEIIEAGGFTKIHKDLKSSPLYGIGIGWRRSHWLRFDGTFEYRGNAVLVAHDTYTGGGTPGANDYTADVKGWLGLANVYWDIYNWCGITPYVGAGIGWATLSVNGLRDVNPVRDTAYYGADKTQTNFAWALYAGASVDVSPQVALDLSYRYVNMGDMSSGVATDYLGTSSYSGMHFKDVTANDFLLGVRYKFDSPAPVAYAVK